ncbi:MFS transporter [Amycolatopsis minnesotensis]|uniref:MFS transporter n=1 Tax=Amycolatopsis minnesotensis TaxID=337894 RepID=A0ABN2R2W6_9PSEU
MTRAVAVTPRPAVAYAGVLLGVFVIVLDTTIVNVAAPRIQEDLHAGVDTAQWVVNGYNLAFAALLLSAGAMADRVGGRKVFLGGLALFALASLACGLSPSTAALIAARVAQGVGAACMLPTALSLAAKLHPEPRARARAFGRWAAIAGAATVLGPLAGGLLVDTLGWRAIFLLNLPVAALAGFLLARNAGETETRQRSFDVGGQVLGIVALAAVAIALTEAGKHGWGSGAAITALVVAALAALALVFVERRARAPMLPPSLVRHPPFRRVSAVGFVLSVGIYGQMFVLSLYFQHARGYSAWATGLALLPFAAVSMVGPVLAGRFIARGAVRGTLVAGQLAGAAGSLLLAMLGAHTGYWFAAIGLVLLGVCQSASQPAVAAATLQQAPAEHTGIASGVMTAARQVGSVCGVALLGGLLGGDVLSGLHVALLIVAALFALAAGLSWTVRPPEVPAQENGSP